MALITCYDILNRSLPSERCSVFYCPGDTDLSLDVTNAWNRTWDSYKMVYKTKLNRISVFEANFMKHRLYNIILFVK